ncbi:uncharacterized protein BXZ73DRAFT_102798 [Epithele typhae]|uniref:uncharacterized protein n=1 Tax=Epithele typhae TaxID=378194 RepID=UPI002008DB3A|nr:uncharacterized protein BXZ73DRAFT_102798 [Epithele typhae]KAH9927212.1 hypothetical protein BXZ73DRAFT_102798 [Epithele typhae]
MAALADVSLLPPSPGPDSFPKLSSANDTAGHDVPAVCNAGLSEEEIYRRKKARTRTWKSGEYQVRKLLPASRLPDCLNARRTLTPPGDLPLCWFGVPLLPDLFLNLSVSLGLAQKSPRGEWYWLRSFYALRDAFEKETGVHFDMEQVWGANPSRPLEPIVAFCSNRGIQHVTEEMVNKVEDLLDMLGYPEDRWEGELRWFPARLETVTMTLARIWAQSIVGMLSRFV